MKKEKILVCISNPNCAEKLIQRGKRIAEAFKGDCIILHVLSMPYNDLNFNQLQTKLMFDSLAKKYHADFIYEHSESQKVSNQIAKVADEHEITQIIIGQAPQTKFELFLHKNTLINSLFEQLDGVDIHIVEVNREITEVENEFDTGIPGHLVQIGENQYTLSLEEDDDAKMNGTFYKIRASDFSNGFFVIKQKGESLVYKVTEGTVEIPET